MPSIELGIEDVSNMIGICDGTSSCAYLYVVEHADHAAARRNQSACGVEAQCPRRQLGEASVTCGCRTTVEVADDITESAKTLQGKVTAWIRPASPTTSTTFGKFERRIAQVEKRNQDEQLAVPEAPWISRHL